MQKLKITIDHDCCTTANVLALRKQLKPLGCKFRGHYALVPDGKMADAKVIVAKWWAGPVEDDQMSRMYDRIG